MKNLAIIVIAASMLAAQMSDALAKKPRSHKISKNILPASEEAPAILATEAPKPQPKQIDENSVVEKTSNKSEKSGITQGHYVGLDLMRSRLEFTEIGVFNPSLGADTYVAHYDNGVTNYAMGVNYKYAFNFDRFFVAPGVFFEQNLGTKDQTTGENGKLKVNNRFGTRADFGYDITERFSPYFTVGLAGVSYKSKYYVDTGSRDANDQILYAFSSKRGTAVSAIYGLGLKFNLDNDLSLNAEYNIQHFTAKAIIDPAAYINYQDRANLKAKLETFKIGISYNF